MGNLFLELAKVAMTATVVAGVLGLAIIGACFLLAAL